VNHCKGKDMKKRKQDRSHAEELRRKAEERMQWENPLPEMSPAEAQKLIHELRVHQIELEMQNDELRQAHEILEESRSRYSDLYDFAPIGYLTLDELGIIREANLTAARQLQVERSRLIDRQFTHFMVTEDRGAFRRHLNLVLKGREGQTSELRLKRKDGEEVFILLESVFYQDTEGSSLCRTAFTDITERRQAEADLRESEERYRSLFQHNHAVMLLIDPATGDIVDANPAASAFYGYTHEELIARKITDINMLPKDRVFKEMQRAGSDQRRQFFFQHRLAGGEVRDVEVFSGPIRIKSQDLLYSIIHDITARKQAEEALQRQEEELQIILDSVPAMIFYKDKENRFIQTNKALAEATGLPKEEMDGKSVFELYPSQAEDYWQDDLEVIKTGTPKRNIIEPFEAAGEIRWVQTDKIPYKDAQGTIIGVIGFSVDITERQRAEEALKDNEERFRTMANAIPQLAWIARSDGYIFWYNQRWYDYTGTTPEEMKGWGWQSVHDQEVLPKVLEQWRASIATGRPFDMVFPLRGGDGQFRQFLTRVMPMKDADGQVIQWFGTNTDITERQRAEEALRESEELYRSLFNNMLNGFAYCQMHFEQDRPVDFTYLEVNDAFEDLTGLKNVVGKKVSEAIPGIRESDPELLEIYGRVALTGKPVTFETYVKALEMWFSISVYSPQREHFVAVFQVITERKQAEEAVRRLNEELEQRVQERTTDLRQVIEQLQAEVIHRQRTEAALARNAATVHDLYNNAPCGYHSLDREGKFVQINDTELAWMGYTREEMLGGMKFSDLLTPASLETFRKYFSGFMERGWANNLEYELVRKDGNILPVLINATVIKDEAGNYLMSRATMFDLSVRRQTEKALRDSEEMLRYLASELLTAQESERKRISLDLHDDLGQSLTVLKMQVRSLERTLPPDSQASKEDCDQLRHNLDNVIDKVRRISRDLSPAVLADMGLPAALRQLTEEFSKYHQARLFMEMDDVQQLFSPEEEIGFYRVFQESLNNIAKHAQADQIKITVKKHKGCVAFGVADNGIGFDIQKLLSDKTKRQGLGLAAMDERVRILGGKLHIESLPGRGTSLSFTIPTSKSVVSS
jgi:PAS domain S-box-containing protein